MFNLPGAGELIVILIIALIVLGPDKLPDAVRKAGRFYGELRRMSSGFQAELRDALDEPMREIRSTTDLVSSTFTSGVDAPAAGDRVAPPPGGAAPAPVAGPDDVGDLAGSVQGDRPVALPPPAPTLPRPVAGAHPVPLPSPFED